MAAVNTNHNTTSHTEKATIESTKQTVALIFSCLPPNLPLPVDTLHALRTHKWSFYDGQYLTLIILGIFSLCIIPSPGALVKTAFTTFIITALLLPVTRQFLLPSLAIWMWLIFFTLAGKSLPLRLFSWLPELWRTPRNAAED